MGQSGHGKTVEAERMMRDTGCDPNDDTSCWRTMFRNPTFSGYGTKPGQEIMSLEENNPHDIRRWYKELLQAADTSYFGVRRAHSSESHEVKASILFYVNTLPILLLYIRYMQEVEKHAGFDAGLDPQQLNRRFQRMRIVYLHGQDKPSLVEDHYLVKGDDNNWRSFIDTNFSFKIQNGRWYLHEETLMKIKNAGAESILTKPRAEGGWDIDPTSGEVNPALTNFLAAQAAN